MTVFRSIDFEATGIPDETDKHALVEIGWCDVEQGIIGRPFSLLCNPLRPIPHESMAVHHITDAMVEHSPPWTLALDPNGLNTLGSPDYFVSHNADFERAFLTTPIPFICTYKVAVRLWPDASQHGLQFLRYHLDLAADAELASPPHRAGPDAYLGALLLQRILAEATVSVDDMVRWSSGPALLPRINFGKHRGEKWEDVPFDYLEWVAYKSDLDRDAKANARHHLKLRSAA